MTSTVDAAAESFDVVITVCDDAREACPVFAGARATVRCGAARRWMSSPRGSG